MKYEAERKISRDKKLIAWRKKHPELSMEEIGQKFGITRARVSQILKRKNGNGL